METAFLNRRIVNQRFRPSNANPLTVIHGSQTSGSFDEPLSPSGISTFIQRPICSAAIRRLAAAKSRIRSNAMAYTRGFCFRSRRGRRRLDVADREAIVDGGPDTPSSSGEECVERCGTVARAILCMISTGRLNMYGIKGVADGAAIAAGKERSQDCFAIDKRNERGMSDRGCVRIMPRSIIHVSLKRKRVVLEIMIIGLIVQCSLPQQRAHNSYSVLSSGLFDTLPPANHRHQLD